MNVVQRAVKTINETVTPSLDNLSPVEASQPDNIPRLQLFYLKHKAKKAQTYKKKVPLKLNEIVKVAKKDLFRQRGFKPRWSSENYHITAVLDNAIPTAYYVSSFGRRLFYREELNPIKNLSDLSSSLSQRKVLGIFGSKQFATQWLRSGKPIKFETIEH